MNERGGHELVLQVGFLAVAFVGRAIALGLALLAPTVPTVAAVVMLVAAVEIRLRSVEEPYGVGRFVPGRGRIGG